MDSLRHFLETFLEGETAEDTLPSLVRFSPVFHEWLLRQSPDELLRRARFDLTRYTRQVLFRFNDLYEIVLIGWLPDQETSMHGHPSGGCLFTVLSGVLREDRVDNQGAIDTRVLDERHAIQYIDDRMHLTQPGREPPSVQPTVFYSKRMRNDLGLIWYFLFCFLLSESKIGRRIYS